VPYSMRGRFLEACDCFVPCPCWFDEDPDEAECSGVVVWQIEQGAIGGVDVSGLAAASVSRHGGHRAKPVRMRITLLIDKRADDAQHEALEQAFSGRLGGPLEELAELSAPAAVAPARISFASDGAETQVSVGQALSVRTSLLTGATARVITVGDGVFARLLGTPGEVGRSHSLRIDVNGMKLVDVADRSTTSGRFAYLHEG
jgi:hypothetical protein